MECIVQNFKKSIHESNFTKEQISIIWDFYVSKSIVSSSSQARTVGHYGLGKLPFAEMLKIADINDDSYHILMADKIDKTLAKCKLQIRGKHDATIPIDIDTPRFAIIMGYTIQDYDEPISKCGRAECLLMHIRNAFAHGNTYFFDNGNMLLEDKNDTKATGMILIKQKTLLDWIAIIDKKQKFYKVEQLKFV